MTNVIFEQVDPSLAARNPTVASVSPLEPLLAAFRSRYGVPALGAGIVTADGELDVAVVGTTARGGSDPAKPDDLWHLGSCCKSITAVLYARLVEQGAARWGTPLPELFPDLAQGIDRRWADSTIDDVFAHRSGLAANPGRREMLAAYRDPSPLREQRTAAVARALARPPRRHGRFVYSNLGYILAGAAIERITDLPFEPALVEHVFDPLGITSAGFGSPPRLHGHGGRKQPLGRFGVVVGRGAPADPRAPESDNPEVFGPAGTLHLTLDDWAKFQRVFLTRGAGLLRPETVERLLTATPGHGRNWGLGWAPADALGCSWGQQGSNANWVATALIDGDRARTAMVVCNDGRTRMLRQTAKLAARLLAAA